MPRLTTEEQKQEMRLIRCVAGWPMWPYLSMKQRQKGGGFPKCATLIDRGSPGESVKIEPVVLYVSIDELITSKKPLDETQVVARYNTIKEMVADDWVTD